MKYRKLRIAWSVAWGIVAVLLCVLWARTRYAIDSFTAPLSSSAGFAIMSRHGGLGVILSDINVGWSYSQYSVERRTAAEIDAAIKYNTVLGAVRYRSSPGQFRIRVPYWSLIVVSAAFMGLPWLRLRFSLRTLLIATTLVAVVLGLIVWAAR